MQLLNAEKSILTAERKHCLLKVPQSAQELEKIGASFPDTILIANMIESGKTPELTAKNLENMGFDIVFWPCTALYTITKAFGEVMSTLRREGTTIRYDSKMLHFSEFNSFIGLDKYNELDKKYK